MSTVFQHLDLKTPKWSMLKDYLIKTRGMVSASHRLRRSLSNDVMAAILVHQNKETSAILVGQNSPLGIKFYF